MIDQVTVQKIIDRSEIVEVVGEFVSLKKRGVNYLGHCPFHNEKTPSFTVSPAKGIYKCFGCGKGGNSVNFIMDIEQISYPEALKYLATKYNIEVVEQEQSPEQIQQKNERESILIVSNYAKEFFVHSLHNTPEGKSIGLSYFHERGFREDIVRKFELGFSPEKYDAFTQNAIQKGYKAEYLVKSGLTIEKEGRRFDRFRGRVMFPIHSLSGRVIAFGGRILKTDKKIAKYLNSPETEIYHKSDILYGMYFAKNAINRMDNCFMVEGYTDVLSMQQAGIENVVASSGTSLTKNQIRLVKRFTKNLTVIYDGDPAGIKASLRGIDLILEEGMNVKVVPLPEGEDPDSFSKARTADELLEYIDRNKQDFIKFKASLLMQEAQSDPVRKAQLLNDIVSTISVIPDTITRSVYIKECQSILKIGEEVIYSEVNKRRGGQAEKEFQKAQKSQAPTQSKGRSIGSKVQNPFEPYEKEITKILLNYSNKEFTISIDGEDVLFSVCEYIISEMEFEEFEFINPQYNRIFKEFSNSFKEGVLLDDRYFANHPESSLSSVAVDLISTQHQLSKIWTRDFIVDTKEIDLESAVPAFVLKYKLIRVKMRLAELSNEIKAAQENSEHEKVMELIQQKMIFDKLKMNIAKEIGDDLILF